MSAAVAPANRLTKSVKAVAPSSYGAADIEVLEGLEAVRRRPSMYIGGVDNRGLHHLLWEVVDNCVDEFLAGHTDKIEVVLEKDGQAVRVRDWGRGIPVDDHPKYKRSALEVILTTLHAGGKFSDKNYARSGGLHGVGSSVVNALSSRMTAIVHRDGYEWVQHYKRGVPVGPVEREREFRGTGTEIVFRPDQQIFKQTRMNPEIIKTHLEDISYIHAGLHIKFTDEAKKETVEFVQPDGIKAYLDKLCKEGKRRFVHEEPFTAEKDDGSIKVELALRWTEATDEQVRSYVNGIRTHAGGTHESGLRAGILKAVRNYMSTHEKTVKGVTIGPEDIREGVTCILSAFHGDPMFQGQTKEKLNNPEMTAFVEGVVRQGVETWMNNNPSVADAVLARLVMAARARAASRAAAADVRGKSGGKKRGALPEKLLDCRGKEIEKNELFLVEGDSAGGTAAMGRDGVTQAVLPLRGKILNTEGLSTGKVLKNAEVKSVVEALGAGIGPNFDESRLRYGRIILLMDADSDGYHISTLLLTFFFRHMPRLVQSGKLFLAQPPLYRISVGNRTEYAMDDAAKEALLAEVPAGRKVEVLRFKGLGEMDSEQLRETTLDPDTRTLLRVDVESQFEADAAFTQLLGKDAGERYRLIMESASLADDLDL
ncbi:DNA gyrase/topoisomerase IV subunit B [Alienimonas californiensis]|uniref:DNA topoisomerase (ATP-hydrolyzing) n=1 Tax=Alienimonas californiensis TaxID=2527989 RepID=A0A517P6A1_9PLAN|nr:DNA topoisomerase IV subunit B [Alienimonas californiensis]QDT14919.1 DNA gyrase subunit B [Alienimonas californiensis]